MSVRCRWCQWAKRIDTYTAQCPVKNLRVKMNKKRTCVDFDDAYENQRRPRRSYKPKRRVFYGERTDNRP